MDYSREDRIWAVRNRGLCEVNSRHSERPIHLTSIIPHSWCCRIKDYRQLLVVTETPFSCLPVAREDNHSDRQLLQSCILSHQVEHFISSPISNEFHVDVYDIITNEPTRIPNCSSLGKLFSVEPDNHNPCFYAWYIRTRKLGGNHVIHEQERCARLSRLFPHP